MPRGRGPRLLSALRSTLSRLSTVLLAARCRLCNELLTSLLPMPVCEACLGRVRPLELLAWCRRCQKPLSLAARETSPDSLCGPCRAGETRVDLLRSFGAYDAELRELVVLLKYHGVRALARPMGGWLALAMEHYPELKAAEVIVPVPLHWRQRRARGFNQALLLARALGRWTGLPVQGRWLRRVKNTRSQTGLTVRQREENVRGAFQVRKKLDKRRILLIDDVCTTGATLNASGGALKRAGAEAVYGLTLARVVQEIEELWEQAS